MNIRKSRIVTTKLENTDNPYEYSNAIAGNDTEDKVFILSESEYNHYFTETGMAFFCEPIDYALSNGAFRSGDMKEDSEPYENATMWWLRTPGVNQSFAMLVLKDGYTKSDGAPVDNVWEGDGYSFFGVCVRPTMWITVE